MFGYCKFNFFLKYFKFLLLLIVTALYGASRRGKWERVWGVLTLWSKVVSGQ